MKILYISRHFNRSGYYIFEELMQTRKKDIAGLVVPRVFNALDNPLFSPLEKTRYRAETLWYRQEPCRFMKSIVRMARNARIPVYFVKSVKTKSFYNLLSKIKPSLIIIGGGWPELLPEKVFSFPSSGTINVHPSLLPEFRGTDIHRWQILKGVKKSGATIHYVDESFDTGPIIEQITVNVPDTETPQSLFEKISRASRGLMSEALKKIEACHPVRTETPEQNGRVEYFSGWPWQDREFFRINWKKRVEDIRNLIRASYQESYSYVGPYFTVKGNTFFVREAGVVSGFGAPPGQIMDFKDNFITVGCGSVDSSIRILRIQKAGIFINWHRSEPGISLIKKYGLKQGDSLL